MDPRVNYTLVGLFVLVLGSGIIATAVWLSGRGDDRVYETYVAYMNESVAGLNSRAAVKYRGVDVGTVRRIGLDAEGRVRLLLDIEEGTPLHDGIAAVLSSYGITGLVFVDLKTVTKASSRSCRKIEKEDERYPEIRTCPSLLAEVSSLPMEVKAAVRQLEQVAKGVHEFLAGSDTRGSLIQVLHNLERISGTLAASDQEIVEGLRRINVVLGDTVQASKRLPEVVGRAGDTLAAFEGTTAAVQRAVQNLDGLIAELRADLRRVSAGPVAQSEPLIGELRQATLALRRLAGDLERQPNLLIYGRKRRPGPGE
jgi:phospholipid/cholesterol/gamma-HCH transport system substrate-binding protein